MISCKLCGGLGNQLFQIFTTIAYAIKYSKPFIFLNNNQINNGSNGDTIRYTYWDTFLTSLKPFLKDIDKMPPLMLIHEKQFHYNPLLEEKRGALLVGYFQSPKYFNDYKTTICKLLNIDLKKKILKEKINYSDNTFTISMHFRLGDYKKYPEFHTILNETYFFNALNYIINNKRL